VTGAGLTPTHLVVGLGNPGAEYRATRHNVGFRVVDELARRWAAVPGRGECSSRLQVAEAALLVQPQTYMNRSGYAVRCLVERYAVAPEQVLVVLDEVALPLGRLRLRAAGSPGGHRGLESVIEQLQSDRVPRLRLGVRAGEEGPAGEALVDFVLAPFAAEEAEVVEAMVRRAADAVEAWRQDGPESAAARYNAAP
jgi:peptidyl-tRNA hydrolase, PTH1 family